MSSSHSAAILVSDQSHHGPPFLAPPSSLAVNGPSPRRRASTSLQVLSFSSQHVPAPALGASGPALERVGRPVLERQHAGGVGPVLERLALRSPVGLLHPRAADRSQAGVGHQLVRARQDRNGVELHRAEPAHHAPARHPSSPGRRGVPGRSAPPAGHPRCSACQAPWALQARNGGTPAPAACRTALRTAQLVERVKVTAQLCEVPAIVAKADEPIGAHRQDRHPVNAKLIGHSGVHPTDPLVRRARRRVR